jgi:tryptophanyl-tRNA synthetase
VKNLLTIYQAFSSEEPAVIEAEFSGEGYKEFKEALAEIIVEKLTPLQERYRDIRGDEAALRRTLQSGREKAAATAAKTLETVKEKMGLS